MELLKTIVPPSLTEISLMTSSLLMKVDIQRFLLSLTTSTGVFVVFVCGNVETTTDTHKKTNVIIIHMVLVHLYL